MVKEQTLSDNIEIVGFNTEVKFKDNDGNIKIFPASKGEKGLKVKDVKDFIKEMDEWIENIGRTTLITGETFMKVLKTKAGPDLI